MTSNAPSDKLAELQRLRERVAELEDQVAEGASSDAWRFDVYWTYYATTGFFLGMLAALSSLLFNVLGSLAIGQAPFKLIAVYLTFGLGEKALDVDTEANGPLALAIGCCLYIGTGMVMGIPFQMVFSRFGPQKTVAWRLAVGSILGIAVWLVNYYLLLSWLQPLLFHGNWIVENVPPLVAAFTHLIFGWTMALAYPLGKYEPYHVRND